MNTYRDQLLQSHGIEIASVVGCGLSRLNRPVSRREVESAVEYYQTNKRAIVGNSDDGGVIPIGDRRQAIADFVEHPRMDSNGVVETQMVEDESEPFMGPMDWLLVAMVFLFIAM